MSTEPLESRTGKGFRVHRAGSHTAATTRVRAGQGRAGGAGAAAGRVCRAGGSVGAIVERVGVGRGCGDAAPLALAAVVVKIL